MDNITQLISLFLTSGAGYFFGWLFSRKRQNIDNVDAAVSTWQKVVDSLEAQVQTQLAKNVILTEENEGLKIEKKSLLVKITELEDKIEAMMSEISDLSELKKQVDVLEKLIADKNRRITELELKIKESSN